MKENIRTENMLCIGCGNPLIIPINKFHACSKCTPKLEKVMYETRMRHRDKNNKTQQVLRPRRMKVIGGIKEDGVLFM
jgi:hypothetical protein